MMAAKPKLSKLEKAQAGLLLLDGAVRNGRASAQQLEYARAVVDGMERLEADKQALAARGAPAAFKGSLAQAPGTDASRAARDQRYRAEGRDERGRKVKLTPPTDKMLPGQ